VLCDSYPPNSLPPLNTVNNPTPICIAPRTDRCRRFQSGLYDRFESLANGYGGCSPNYWPKTQAEADKSSSLSKREGTTSPTIRATSRCSSPTTPRSRARIRRSRSSTSRASTRRVGILATGNGKPKGCYGFPPSPNTCGAPNNDAHPLLGCLQGNVTSTDNGDLWGHFVRFVDFSSTANPSDDLCALTGTSAETCVATLVE
jgi:hypothetical protein